MSVDLSLLQDFQLNEDYEWSRWQFRHEDLQHVPVTFFNRFNKTLIKCSDLSAIQTRKQEDSQFIVIEGNTKVFNKEYISKNIKMGDRRKATIANSRNYTKKQRKNMRTWHNQYKTKFKEITAKNDWIIVRNINKRDLSELAPNTMVPSKVEELKYSGHLQLLNEKVLKISWNPTGFRENEEYKVKPVVTLQNSALSEIANELVEEEAESNRISVICSIEFLLAIMTVRGGQYPWNIQIDKYQNVILFENYKPNGEENEELSYLDLFTTNQNTTNNMPSDEGKVRDQCVAATKMTRIFRDLLASGGSVNSQFEEVNELSKQEAELDYLQKCMKISLSNIDIYTNVRIDGVKRSSDGQVKPCLIRCFMETGTDGGWLQYIKKSPGTMIFQEYLDNSCSLQKWICEASIAEVEEIKLGFIGFSKQKPLLFHVHETKLKDLQSHISFNHKECWPIVKYLVDIIASCEDGSYILSRGPYNPLSLKLFKMPKDEKTEEAEPA